MKDKIKFWYLRWMGDFFCYLECKIRPYYKYREKNLFYIWREKIANYCLGWEMYSIQYRYGLIKRMYGEQDWECVIKYPLDEKYMRMLKPRLKQIWI